MKQSNAEAARYYRKACEETGGEGCGYLGFFYEFGLGGLSKDDIEATRLYRLACERGGPAAASVGCLGLAKMYEQARGGLTTDLDEASRLRKKGHALGLREFRESCDNGIGEACSGLASWYEEGAMGLRKDDDKARAFYRRACDLERSRDSGSDTGCTQLKRLEAQEAP